MIFAHNVTTLTRNCKNSGIASTHNGIVSKDYARQCIYIIGQWNKRVTL